VDKIAQSMIYMSPLEKQKRGLEMAQIAGQNQLLPLQLQTQQAQLEMERRFLDQAQGQQLGGTGAGSPFVTPKGVGFLNPEQASTIQKNQAITNSVNQKSGLQKTEIDNARSINEEADRIRKQQQNQPIQNNPPTTQNIDQNPDGVNSTMINPLNLPLLQQEKRFESQDDNENQYS
jgi:hypothetical protein